MHPSLASLLILLGPVAMAQPAFEREAPLGPMGVGYTDTLLHAAGVEYSGFGYTGPAPLFVQHWFPMDAKNRSAPLSYGALRERQLPDGLASVYAALHAEMERSFIATDLSGSYPDHDPIDYGKSSLAEVLEQVMHTATRSQRAAPARRSDAPVIIYPHGSQGSSDENVAMAEYFASRGYDLVSAISIGPMPTHRMVWKASPTTRAHCVQCYAMPTASPPAIASSSSATAGARKWAGTPCTPRGR